MVCVYDKSAALTPIHEHCATQCSTRQVHAHIFSSGKAGLAAHASWPLQTAMRVRGVGRAFRTSRGFRAWLACAHACGARKLHAPSLRPSSCSHERLRHLLTGEHAAMQLLGAAWLARLRAIQRFTSHVGMMPHTDRTTTPAS